jgi:2-methylcitrate dehydratase PrpD
MSRDTMEVLCGHAAGTRPDEPDDAARHAARVFILDSLGVCIAGSTGPLCAALLDAHGASGPARVLGTGTRLSAAAAALLNAYQVHNSEFDCIHDAAVVHPMAVLLGAALATVDCADRPVSGAEFLTAVTVGVDVGCRIGAASRSPMRFFRPATAAAARLSNFDQERMLAAMGITLAQLCGTMQAHLEGSALLPVQAGFNARNAVVSRDLAALEVSGARNVLDGPFGYFALFEGDHDPASVLADLGVGWRISEVSHKPFPSGRATHGIVDACLELRRQHGFEADDVAEVEARVPPLTHRLVSRPPAPSMQSNYARLCGAYVAARAILFARVGLDDFTPQALGHEQTLALAGRIRLVVDDNDDPNALAPVTVRIGLESGDAFEQQVSTVYGSPAKPMSREAHLAKFRTNCAAGAEPPSPEGVEAAIRLVDTIEDCRDIRELLDLLGPADS